MNEQINSVKKHTINNIKTVMGDYKKTLNYKTPKIFGTISMFYIFLAVHLRIILVSDQLGAQRLL